MCKSLAEGGLRCESHLSVDITNIKTEYKKGLEGEADKAGVALDPKFVAKIVEEHKNNLADSKVRLLDAHALAVEAKAELENNSSEKEYPDYSALEDELAKQRVPFRSHFYPREKVVEQALMIERLQRSGIAEFGRGTEYVETFHLAKHCTERIEKFGPQDTPERVAKFKALQDEKDSIDASLNILREHYKYGDTIFDTDYVEEAIVKLPPPNLSKLLYKHRVEVFNQAKQAYVEESNKIPSDEKSLRSYVKEHNGGKTPFDKEAMLSYKKDVYDKTDKVVALQGRLKDKQSQIELTSGYRKRLGFEAQSRAFKGDHATAEKMFRKKEALDIKADITMLQNRMRAPINS